MITVPTAPWLHYAGDAASWAVAALGARWVYRHRRSAVERLARQTRPGYFIALSLGALAGAWLFGSLNSLRFAVPAPSHSIGGALAGAITGVELWKWRHGVRESTGGPFVIPLAIGIVIGRWGCLFAGLADGTYGTPTPLPWAVDLGDGIGRHPVQIYESLSMAAFLALYCRAIVRHRDWAVRTGFHWFVLAYAAQRFAWEFLKPYPPLLGPLNLFHFLMLGLAAYALTWIARDARRTRTV
ncbi:prolipoprotein diacylglyceryl transferase [Sphingomonas psychrotolerans]|uniref:Prolipoprotein diacylglyceryl transferase n=1 Tax=Sphingomonas psychrotolerans TaxID=1327635 RepID=A0ABU3N4T9_9SPHN|nr:prolipoprotein diacylglyceryl transferase family protein [Sphingomonas psychrotolerans]MDT8759544.1 prolipoprotein diacylglyceryl transferase [Sphingomonas psychrotolerans]